MLYRLRLVVLDGDSGTCYAESLLDQRGSNNDLLSLLKKGTEVGCEVRLTFASVDDQHLALLSWRRGQFHVGREGRSAESDDSAETDLLDDGLAVLRDIGHQSLGAINALKPLVTFHSDLHIGLGVAGEILARAD